GIPALSARDMAYFKDMLETAATEIVEFSRTAEEQEQRISELSRELSGRYQFANIIGKAAPMQRLFALLEKVVDSESTVLIAGDAGEASARHPGGNLHPGRRYAAAGRRCSDHRRDQPRPQVDGGAARIPRRPLLPPERPQHRGPALALTARGPAGPRRSLPAQ